MPRFKLRTALKIGCLALIGCAALPALLLSFGIFRTWKHTNDVRSQLLKPSDFGAIARDMALACQTAPKETGIQLTSPVDGAALPPSLRSFNPTFVYFDQEGGAEFEMLGGFDHCGYRLLPNDEGTSGTTNIWDLFYYSEGDEPKLLATVTLDKSARKP